MSRKKPELTISEFTFAYNFLHEQHLLFQNDLIGVPILPSLLDETDVGFDACLPTRAAIFFYQFKRSHNIIRVHPRRLTRDPPPYPAPFYRIYLHRKNNYAQHFQLQYWANLYPCTYYVAPETTDNTTYFDAAIRGETWKCSRCIPLISCPVGFDVTEPKHFIEYKKDVEQAILCSDHVSIIKNTIFGRDLKRLYLEQKYEPIDELAMKLSDNTINFIAKYWGKEHTKKLGYVSFSEIPQKQEIVKSLQLSSSILSSYLGVTPLLFGKRGS